MSIPGNMQSIGTGGWWLTPAGAATGQPSLVIDPANPVTATTANLLLTPPTDADYLYSDVLWWAEGSGTPTVISPFTGAALTGLTPGTKYFAQAIAYNTGGLRSLPSMPPVEWQTLISESGTYLATIKLFTDGSATPDQTYVANLALGYHRIPWDVRGATGRIQITMSDVGKQVEFTGTQLTATNLGRRD